AAFSPRGTTLLNGSGSASSPQQLEVMSQDQGANDAGFFNNFAYGTLSLGGGAYVKLVDNVHNSTGNMPEALYVNALILPGGSTRALNGLNLSAHTVQGNGSVVNGTINVIKAPTATTVSSSANTAVYGQAVTFTATVTGGGTPVGEGTVTFYEGSTALFGPVTVDASGHASYLTSSLSVAGSPHMITAKYSGTTNFITSSSNSISLAINPRVLHVSATAMDRAYDGTTTATVTLSDDRITGDVLTDSNTSATFSDKNVGSAKTVTVSGISISGAAAGNYTLAATTI